jgi:hypothetical protein
LRKALPVWHHEQYIGALEQEPLHAVHRRLGHRDSLPLVEARRKQLEVYCRIAELRPEMILKPPNPLLPLPLARSVREGQRNVLIPRPVRLGVGLSFDEHDTPHLTFEKEEFSLSEAASYFAYILDVVMRAQRG